MYKSEIREFIKNYSQELQFKCESYIDKFSDSEFLDIWDIIDYCEESFYPENLSEVIMNLPINS